MNNIITFPLLNLVLKISPVAFTIFGIDVYWYGIIITLAILISIVLLKINLSNNKEKSNVKFEDILDLIIIILPISVICARIYYILFRLDYYMKYPSNIFNIREGGLAIYGGIIGAVIVICFFAKKRKISILEITDIVVPYLALSQSMGRWGNFINVEAYGTETTLPWRMGIIEKGIYKEVHPAFLYESICTAIIFTILLKINKNKKFKGETTYIYIILYSFIRMIIETIRKDSLMLDNFRISGLLSLFLFVTFSIILIYKIINNRKTNNLSKK